MPEPDKITPGPKATAGDPLIELTTETLRGDVRDALLNWFKAQPKSWPFMSQREQKDLAEAADRFSFTVVKEAAEIIAKGERPSIVGKLVEYKEKDGVDAKLKFGATGETIQALHEACGQEVLLVATGASDFSGEKASADAHVESDQRDLGIGDEYKDEK
jgi:hypothetical protein